MNMTVKQQQERAEIIFHEAVRYMTTYFQSLPAGETRFKQFQLTYDGESRRLHLTVQNFNDDSFELECWSNFNFTMFKRLIQIANQFRRDENKPQVFQYISILVTMIL